MSLKEEKPGQSEIQTKTKPANTRANTKMAGLKRHYIEVPRWPAVVVLLLIGLLYSVLSESLTIVPGWVLLTVIGLLLIVTVALVIFERHDLSQILAHMLSFLVTLGLISSIILLLTTLPSRSIPPVELFRDALLLWTTNVLVFGLWYWQLDRGGPTLRHSDHPGTPELLFPQMTQPLPEWSNWIPTFLDYLFVAFNTNTAFSPTDTAVLSRRCKCLTMLQAAISLIALVVLAARAINIL